MKLKVLFALVREGTTDDALVTVLESLLLRAGAHEAVGLSRPYTGPVAEKLAKVAAEEQTYDIVFVHRDADSTDPAPRRQEIAQATSAVDPGVLAVPVIPVQETEAWLLVDEAAIRRVVGRPSGKVPLGLPPVRRIENTAGAKEVLRAACLAAAEHTGRRRAAESKKFGERRRQLIHGLDLDGPVTRLPSWQALVADVEQAVAQLRNAEQDGR